MSRSHAMPSVRGPEGAWVGVLGEVGEYDWGVGQQAGKAA